MTKWTEPLVLVPIITAIIASIIGPMLLLYWPKLPIQTQPTTLTSGKITDSKVVSTSGRDTVSIASGSSSPSSAKDYIPDSLNVSAGTTVIWTNDDSTLHTVTSGTPEGGSSGREFDSSYLAAGKTFQHSFDIAGTFDYYCTLHPYMTGEVIVS